MFVRHHQHADANAPTLLLLHGWTASADTQFFTTYETLASAYSIIAVDHRGHGRGLRPNIEFSLEDCADDAAAVVRALGVTSVCTVGYSMGGPISMLVWKRHADLVAGMVLQATALEWNSTSKERFRWKISHFLAPLFRKLSSPRVVQFGVKRLIPRGHEMHRFVPWLLGETRRNDAWIIHQAGQALAKFDGTILASTIRVPVSYVLTLRDRLVPPHKQKALASATNAHIIELDGDHFVSLEQPKDFAAATRQAVDFVTAQFSQQ
jgi:3-oxoadipate enol-lactonase